MATTHEVRNQVPERAGIDEFATNAPLVEAVAKWGSEAGSPARGGASDRLTELGRLVGSEPFQRDAELANTRPPVLRSHDRWGRRIDEVDYDESYHRIMAAAVGAGAHTSAWAEPGPGANVDRAAAFFLLAQVEPGHACPISMTHAAVPTLRLGASGLIGDWMPRLLSRDYDPSLAVSADQEFLADTPDPDTSATASRQGIPDPRTAPAKRSALIGMAMTEKQGGSDVRANTTRAEPTGADTPWGREVVLTGHKWFCSAPMSDAFLVLAQTDGGLSCAFVPRIRPDGSRNAFAIQRLKDKLGNRSNASSEVEFDGTVGYLVGDEGRGVATIVQMVTRTRLDCVIGSAAGMRQAVAEAAWHVRHRRAFGSLLVDQPAMRAVAADLALESEAATWTAMRLAAAYDDDADASTDAAFRRLATAVAKYHVCKRGAGHAAEALECLGGNGYTEAWPLARRYREQPLLAIWEGSGNVIALDVLRVLGREPEAFEAFFEVVRRAGGADAAFDVGLAHAESLARETARDLADPGAGASVAALRARELTERLALVLQGALLIEHAPAAVADAFCATRLGGEGGAQYGVLPRRADLTAILARA
ncbi:acyl-CoA dehydrogenase family protein [Agromyces larvae]|uniref:Acyl-CoA dehydrogenase family protein n=1 Tax=Agromyces larvae TaxID=2929802 RepID=A0ABY4BV81_9MICO|nr:acyl-CoA dehydrogenase family protein [Agromyces larvae]UOE42804.1 acyl-CoA dehydrogenase family protein [Agromyces larvae]